MKNTVSFEMAKRLKEAGFPQPDPEFGQFWIDKDEAVILGGIGKASKARHCLIDGHGGILTDDFIVDRLVFAPTATDILKEIPFVLKLIAKNENPHEAAALAWLSIQEIQKK